MASIPYDRVLATATHISTDIDFRPVSDGEMEAGPGPPRPAGAAERDIYASYIQEAFLTSLEAHGDRIVYQFSLGAEPLPHETASRLSQRTIAQVAEMIGGHPRLRFQCFLASRHANQSMCTLARELPNLSLARLLVAQLLPRRHRPGPARTPGDAADEQADRVLLRRLLRRVAYAKAVLVQRSWRGCWPTGSNRGQYSLADVLSVARAILFESPRTLLKFAPRATK